MTTIGPICYYSSHDQGSGSVGGGGPDDRPRVPAFVQRTQGLMSLAFGFALGLTFVIFFGIFSKFGTPITGLQSFFADFNVNNALVVFLYGFIGGTLLAVIYNIMIVRHLNLFSLETAGE